MRIKSVGILLISVLCLCLASQYLEDDDANRREPGHLLIGIRYIDNFLEIRTLIQNPLFAEIFKKSLERDINIFAKTGNRSKVYTAFEVESQKMKNEDMLVELRD